MLERLTLAKSCSLIFVSTTCVVISRPMKIVTFPRENDVSSKWSVGKTEIVEDFACEVPTPWNYSNISHFSFFVFSIFEFFQYFLFFFSFFLHYLFSRPSRPQNGKNRRKVPTVKMIVSSGWLGMARWRVTPLSCFSFLFFNFTIFVFSLKNVVFYFFVFLSNMFHHWPL